MFERFTKEARAQRKLAASFNNAAKMEEALTKLHKENPKFDFLKEQNEKGAYFVTNIPLKGWGNEGRDMEIHVSNGGLMGLTTDEYERGMKRRLSVETHRVKKAVKVVGKHIGRRDLAS